MARKKRKKTIRTSKKRRHSFTLTTYYLINDDGEILPDDQKQEITNYLIQRCQLMKQNETEYYQTDFPELVNKIAQQTTEIPGKKNAALRELIPTAKHQPNDQPYNFNEMFRQNIGNHLEIYLQRNILEEIITNNPQANPYEIQQEYIQQTRTKDYPTTNAIRKYQRAIQKTGHIDKTPTSTGQLPLSACDGHYRQVIEKDGLIRLSIQINGKTRYLVFVKPHGHDKMYFAGKITAPTIRISRAGNLVFDFTAQCDRPRKRSLDELSGVIGVDAGIVHEFTGSYVTWDGTCSQPLSESGRCHRLGERIEHLYGEIAVLEAKARECECRGHFDKADVLYAEASARGGKISRLKRARCEVAAVELVGLALVLDAGLVVEDLSWVPESHWDVAQFQEVLSCLAADYGLPVVSVGAGGSSCMCARDGGGLSVRSGRRVCCGVCGRVLDRDVSASRVVACRGLGLSCVCGFSYFNCLSRGGRRECMRLARARLYGENPHGAIPTPVSVPLITDGDPAFQKKVGNPIN